MVRINRAPADGRDMVKLSYRKMNRDLVRRDFSCLFKSVFMALQLCSVDLKHTDSGGKRNCSETQVKLYLKERKDW